MPRISLPRLKPPRGPRESIRPGPTRSFLLSAAIGGTGQATKPNRGPRPKSSILQAMRGPSRRPPMRLVSAPSTVLSGRHGSAVVRTPSKTPNEPPRYRPPKASEASGRARQSGRNRSGATGCRRSGSMLQSLVGSETRTPPFWPRPPESPLSAGGVGRRHLRPHSPIRRQLRRGRPSISGSIVRTISALIVPSPPKIKASVNRNFPCQQQSGPNTGEECQRAPGQNSPRPDRSAQRHRSPDGRKLAHASEQGGASGPRSRPCARPAALAA